MNKAGRVTEQVRKAEKKAALEQDLESFFPERDKTKRGLDGKLEEMTEESAAETEVREMIYKASLKDTPLPKDVDVLFNGMFVTARRNKVKTEGGILIAQEGVVDCDYQEVQKVLRVGATIKNDPDGLREGWEVVLNFDRFRDFRAAETGSMSDKVNKTKTLNIPIEIVDNTEYILITDRDIKYIKSK